MKISNFFKLVPLSALIIALLVLAFRIAYPPALKLYLEAGIGNCSKIPALCIQPSIVIIDPPICQSCIDEFTPVKFDKICLSIPKGFSIVQELQKKIYYKKGRSPYKNAVIYCLGEEPGFFIKLFPQVAKVGINNNYAFIRRVMTADNSRVDGLMDAFFVIMKSIFIPDLGDQAKARMLEFSMKGRRGIILFNTTGKDYYFACDIVDAKDYYYKVYIKDKGGKLDLEKVFAVISTVGSPE